MRFLIPHKGGLLEIASGSGEHGIFFQKNFLQLFGKRVIQKLSIEKVLFPWIDYYDLSSRMPDPLDIEVENRPWPITNQLRSLIKGIVCINMIHISPCSYTEALFEESKRILDRH